MLVCGRERKKQKKGEELEGGGRGESGKQGTGEGQRQGDAPGDLGASPLGPLSARRGPDVRLTTPAQPASATPRHAAPHT